MIKPVILAYSKWIYGNCFVSFTLSFNLVLNENEILKLLHDDEQNKALAATTINLYIFQESSNLTGVTKDHF